MWKFRTKKVTVPVEFTTFWKCWCLMFNSIQINYFAWLYLYSCSYMCYWAGPFRCYKPVTGKRLRHYQCRRNLGPNITTEWFAGAGRLRPSKYVSDSLFHLLYVLSKTHFCYFCVLFNLDCNSLNRLIVSLNPLNCYLIADKCISILRGFNLWLKLKPHFVSIGHSPSCAGLVNNHR